MKRVFLLPLLINLIIGIAGNTLQAQEKNAAPYSLMFQMDDAYQKIKLRQPDLRAIEEEDKLNDAIDSPKPKRMGVSVAVGRGIEDDGTWTEVPGLGKIWRIALKADDALALGVYYDQFFIPEGAELYLYNPGYQQVLGPITSKDNPPVDLYATQFVGGDEVILEYFQPDGLAEQPKLHISELAYAYRFINYGYDNTRDAWWCMINVACEEGDGWENQIKGVARISIKIASNYYWCSGSLINNTDNDRTPYFLTASHCGGTASSSDLNQWIFYFNYQASTCDGTGSGYNSKTGCVFKAHDPGMAEPDVPGSDFYLVKINGTIPDSYDVFYNGWNRTNDNEDAGNGVSIHHPAGDIKKISTYDTPLTTSYFWNGQPTHWKCIWAETVNGKSIMQGGSSGSPIFDSNGLIMGDLTGGYTSNSCTNPSPAYYGKMYWSWDQNGNTDDKQLEPWLDPAGTGIEKLPGVSWEIIPPVADFVSFNTNITQGDSVFFSDLSGPGILEWQWTFEGGNPDTSYIQDAFAVYPDTGYFDVSLYVVNADGNDTELKEDYVHVGPMALPEAGFIADDTIVSPGGKVHFTDQSSSTVTQWQWTFEGGSPATSTNQNPTVRYSNLGVFDVTLVVTNLAGNDTIVKEGYITVSDALPEADFEADDTHISQDETVNFSDLSIGFPDTWAWTFEGGTPETSSEQNPQEIIYNQGGAFNVTLTVTNGNGEDTKTIEDYILVDWVGIDELGGPDDFRVYPNPGTGIFVLEFAETGNEDFKLVVSDTYGKTITSNTFSRLNKTYVLDLSDVPEGVYFVSLTGKGNTVVKKLSVHK